MTARAEQHLMTVDEAATFLRYTETALDPAHATRQWLKRKGIPTTKRGRNLLVNRSAVADALYGTGASRRSA